MIGIVHGSRMDGEPIDHTDVFIVSANNFQHRHQSVRVVLIEGIKQQELALLVYY